MKYLMVLLAALVFSATAQASTRLDAVKVAWYLKGEGDAVLPVVAGQVITDLKCRPTASKYVTCTNRTVTPDYKHVYCDKGKFYIKDYAVVGQWAKPKPCAPGA